MTTASADANKRRRDAARDRGDCLTCCRAKARPGKSTCQPCGDLKAKWNQGHAAAPAQPAALDAATAGSILHRLQRARISSRRLRRHRREVTRRLTPHRDDH